MEPRVFRPGDTARMKLNSTLIGVVVLALVATGVFWVRSRTAGSAIVPAGQASPSSAGQRAKAPDAGDDALPDVTLAAGTVDAGDVRVTLALSPQPPVAFAKTRVRVRAESGGSPVAIEGRPSVVRDDDADGGPSLLARARSRRLAGGRGHPPALHERQAALVCDR